MCVFVIFQGRQKGTFCDIFFKFFWKYEKSISAAVSWFWDTHKVCRFVVSFSRVETVEQKQGYFVKNWVFSKHNFKPHSLGCFFQYQNMPKSISRGSFLKPRNGHFRHKKWPVFGKNNFVAGSQSESSKFRPENSNFLGMSSFCHFSFLRRTFHVFHTKNRLFKHVKCVQIVCFYVFFIKNPSQQYLS